MYIDQGPHALTSTIQGSHCKYLSDCSYEYAILSISTYWGVYTYIVGYILRSQPVHSAHS